MLDTHALLWALAQPQRLPGGVADALRDPGNSVHLSAARTLEIGHQGGARQHQSQSRRHQPCRNARPGSTSCRSPSRTRFVWWRSPLTTGISFDRLLSAGARGRAHNRHARPCGRSLPRPDALELSWRDRKGSLSSGISDLHAKADGGRWHAAGSMPLTARVVASGGLLRSFLRT